jgi:hypothetical protein
MKRVVLALAVVLMALPIYATDRDDVDGSPIVVNVPDGLTDWQWGRAVLHDNGPLVTNPGGGSGGADISELQTAIGMGTYGFGHQVSAGNRIADDFDVVDAAGWHIDTITFFAYQTGAPTSGTITAVNLQIWDNVPGTGTVVWGDDTTNVMTSTGWTNIYRVLDTAPTDTQRAIMANVVTVNVDLPQGTYWLDWQSDGSLSSGPWAPPITILGQTTTGNAMQYTTTNGFWDVVVDGGTGTGQGFPFIIEGDILPVELQSFSVE